MRSSSQPGPVTFTFDTNCVNARGKHPALNQLEQWRQQGLIEIFSTTSMEEELLGDGDPNWGPRRLQKARSYSGMDTAVWVLGYSRLGISTKLGGDSTQDEMERIAAILFPGRGWFDLKPNQVRDVMALHTHWSAGRDIFVTLNTRDFIRKDRKNLLRKQFGASVMTPDEAVRHIQATPGLSEAEGSPL